MTFPLIFALLSRFYHFSLGDIADMTLKQVAYYMSEIGAVTKLLSGQEMEADDPDTELKMIQQMATSHGIPPPKGYVNG